MLPSTSLNFPSPPVHPQRPPPPPPAPRPWLWRCHQCHIVYRLATTRRCLECDHEFCLATRDDDDDDDDDHHHHHHRHQPPSLGARKRKQNCGGGPCRAEFDYVGWAAHSAWKRTVLLLASRRRRLPASSSSSSLARAWGGGHEHRVLLGRRGTESLAGSEFADDEEEEEKHENRKALFVRRRHSCWLHCDFPSECNLAVREARRDGKPVFSRARAVCEAYVRSETAEAAGVEPEEEGSDGPRGLRRSRSTHVLAKDATRGGWLSSPGIGLLQTMVEDEDEDGSSDEMSDEEEEEGGVSPRSLSSPQDEVTKARDPFPAMPDRGFEGRRTLSTTQRGKRCFTDNNFKVGRIYKTSKESTASTSIITPKTSTSPKLSSPNSPRFEIHAKDSSLSHPTSSPSSSSSAVTPSPIPIPGTSPGDKDPRSSRSEGNEGEQQDLETFLASLYQTTAAQHPPLRYKSKRARLAVSAAQGSDNNNNNDNNNIATLHGSAYHEALWDVSLAHWNNEDGIDDGNGQPDHSTLVSWRRNAFMSGEDV